jgi:hypothetical protein
MSQRRRPTLAVVREPCGRRALRRRAAHRQAWADMRLPELLTIVADGPKARSFSIYDRCKAQYARYCGVLNISREPLRYLRGPGEGYSDVILRLVEVG